MKRTFLKFDGQGRPLFGLKRLADIKRHAAFKTGSEGGGDDDDDEDDEDDEDERKPEKALLTKIQRRVAKELKTRGYMNAEAVTAAITKHFEGYNLEALREYGDKKYNETITKLAAGLEKIEKNRVQPGQKRNWFRDTLNKHLTDFEPIARSRGEDKKEIKFNVRAAAIMDTSNTLSNDDTLPEDILESFSIAEFAAKRYGRQYIYDIADRTVVSEVEQYKTWLEEGDEEGAFAIVAEGAIKPLVSYDLVRNFAQAKKVAGKYVVTEEFTKFRKNAFNIIRRLIMDKLVRDYSAIITTDLNALAAAYTGTALDGTINGANDYDAVGAVAAQIESLNFVPDVLILNPQDKWRIRLTKDNEGRYLFPMVLENGQTVMMGFRIITSTYQTVGTFTLGESGLYKIEEEPVTVRMGYGIEVTGSNPVTAVSSDFDNNRIRVIVETYFLSWLATPHVGSFVRTTFATVKAALETP